MKQLCFAHNANKVAMKHISLHICGMISLLCVVWMIMGAIDL